MQALTTPRGTCTAAGGLDAETFRGFQLAGELFLLTSFFIEPMGCKFDSHSGSQTNLTTEFFRAVGYEDFRHITEAALRSAVREFSIEATDRQLESLMQAYLVPAAVRASNQPRIRYSFTDATVLSVTGEMR
jgi:hypothetical protein